MFKSNKFYLFIIFLSLLAINLNAQSHYRSAKFEIPKMTCKVCAKHIKAAFKNSEGEYEKGIFNIITEPEKNLVTFKFEKEIWKASDIISKLKQIGYEPNRQ